MKKRYIVGIVVAIVAILAWFAFSNKATAPAVPEAGVSSVATTTSQVLPVAGKPTAKSTAPAAPAMTKSGSYIVSYTNTGFSPATITIRRGKSVHFVNNSIHAMSIMAVDQNSQIYRELNQEQSLGRGGYYDFAFVTPGTWVYTNRNNRSDRGTIIVE